MTVHIVTGSLQTINYLSLFELLKAMARIQFLNNQVLLHCDDSRVDDFKMLRNLYFLLCNRPKRAIFSYD